VVACREQRDEITGETTAMWQVAFRLQCNHDCSG
jgi:hypothetical protein